MWSFCDVFYLHKYAFIFLQYWLFQFLYLSISSYIRWDICRFINHFIQEQRSNGDNEWDVHSCVFYIVSIMEIHLFRDVLIPKFWPILILLLILIPLHWIQSVRPLTLLNFIPILNFIVKLSLEQGKKDTWVKFNQIYFMVELKYYLPDLVSLP